MMDSGNRCMPFLLLTTAPAAASVQTNHTWAVSVMAALGLLRCEQC